MIYRSGTLITVLAIAIALSSASAAERTADASVPPASAVVGYKLYPGDLLHIQVFDNPDLETDIRVPDTGTITFPLIGQVKELVGRTVEDFTNELSRRLMDGYLRQAVVTITVKDFGKRLATVMGSVTHPGPVSLDPLRVTTAMQAIGEAGGFSDDANRIGAMVIRDNPQTDEKLALQVPKGDKPSDLVKDIVLEPGDIIIVPRLDRVFILGQVTKPGAVNLPSQEPLTVSKAVSLAGGFDKFAKQSNVQLIRSGQKVQEVDVRKILTGDSREADPKLNPGDTVYVPESRF
ncbi:MAG: polysaccharide biosynthesis/export family protein [Planctomycetes bacterium]|nr:polysaccharide biosynthesis/export family protein [Planctomycetota bacterium]